MSIFHDQDEDLRSLARDMAKILHRERGHGGTFHSCPQPDCLMRRSTIDRGASYVPTESALLATGDIRRKGAA